MVIEVGLKIEERDLLMKINEMNGYISTLNSKKDQLEYIEKSIKELINRHVNIFSEIIIYIRNIKFQQAILQQGKKYNDPFELMFMTSDLRSKIVIDINNDLDEYDLYNYLKINKVELLLDEVKLSEKRFSMETGIDITPVLYFINHWLNEILKLEKNFKLTSYEVTGKEKIFEEIRWLFELNNPQIFIEHLIILRSNNFIKFKDNDFIKISKLEKKIIFNGRQNELIALFEFWQYNNFIHDFKNESQNFSNRLVNIFDLPNKELDIDSIKSQYTKKDNKNDFGRFYHKSIKNFEKILKKI